MTILKRPIRVFLIHTHRDREPVRELYARLAKDGIKPWLDSERLQPGQDWRHEINRSILTSDFAIVCLSMSFIRHQGYCQQEIKIALKKASLLPVGETFIIPARLEECDSPDSLSRWQRVDLFEADGYKRLIRSLRRHVKLNEKWTVK